MNILAHAPGGYGLNSILSPWELHPILIHFPIAFLLGGVLLSLYANWRGRLLLEQMATGLLIAGLLTGVLAALAGVLAFFTLPGSHTETAHRLMTWHLGAQVAALVLFTAVAWLRWRTREGMPGVGTKLLGWVASGVFVIGSALGGYTVYHGGAGIEPALLKPGLHEEHHQGSENHDGSHEGGSETSDRDKDHHDSGQFDGGLP